MANGSYDTRVNPGGFGLEDLLALLEKEQEANPSVQYTQAQPRQDKESGGGGNMNTYNQIMDRIQGQQGGSGGGAGLPINGQEINGMNVHWGPNQASGLGSSSGTSGTSGLSGSGGSGSSGAGSLGYVVAAILAQMMATSDTDTVFEGQQTGNFFSGSDDPNEMNPEKMGGNWRPRVFTEPWLAWGHDKLGWDPTMGEKMDAAVQNEDWGTALERLPAAADYWADPIRSWLGYDTWKNIGESVFGDDSDLAEVLGFLSDPIQGILQQLEEWF